MLESLVDISYVQRRPTVTFLWALIVASVGIAAASQINSVSTADFGFLSVLFTIIPSVYFMVLLIKREERAEEKSLKKGRLPFWELHGRDILILLLYFFGVTTAFALWSFALPGSGFESQVTKINDIRGTGALAQEGLFSSILLNNLQVMTVAFAFSLIFGAGAIFIIVWNASVLGVFIGKFSKSALHFSIVYLGFLPHGALEIGGYLAAALAGGILSTAILRRNTHILGPILLDSCKLMVFGIALLVAGAMVEVYI